MVEDHLKLLKIIDNIYKIELVLIGYIYQDYHQWDNLHLCKYYIKMDFLHQDLLIQIVMQ